MEITDLGLISYSEAYKIQKNTFDLLSKQKKENKKTKGKIFFCEHPAVFTSGKNADRTNLLVSKEKLKEINAEFFEIDRGGDITFHGPGQIVVYPIIDLDVYKKGVKDYIYFLEYMIIDILKDYGIKGEISKGNIGVWLDVGKKDERKICSIGVKTGRGITMHGLALNVNTDLSYFDYINPCGFTDKGVTSMKKELNSEQDKNEIKDRIKQFFKNNLQL